MISLLNSELEPKCPPVIKPYCFDLNMEEQDDKEYNGRVKKYDGLVELEAGVRITDSLEEILGEMAEVEASSRELEEADDDEALYSLKEAEKERQAILEQAESEAAAILAEARAEAEEMKNSAKDVGYQEGYEEGLAVGRELGEGESAARLEKEEVAFLQELQMAASDFERRKAGLLDKYCDDLCDLALTIAEKVIHISLKSSSEVISNMILAATEKSRNKEWARINISNHDASLMVHEGIDILEELQQISPHIKVIVMESEQPGACIIEFPDQIIDAGVNTQLDNIRELMEENRLHGRK